MARRTAAQKNADAQQLAAEVAAVAVVPQTEKETVVEKQIETAVAPTATETATETRPTTLEEQLAEINAAKTETPTAGRTRWEAAVVWHGNHLRKMLSPFAGDTTMGFVLDSVALALPAINAAKADPQTHIRWRMARKIQQLATDRAETVDAFRARIDAALRQDGVINEGKETFKGRPAAPKAEQAPKAAPTPKAPKESAKDKAARLEAELVALRAQLAALTMPAVVAEVEAAVAQIAAD